MCSSVELVLTFTRREISLMESVDEEDFHEQEKINDLRGERFAERRVVPLLMFR